MVLCENTIKSTNRYTLKDRRAFFERARKYSLNLRNKNIAPTKQHEIQISTSNSELIHKEGRCQEYSLHSSPGSVAINKNNKSRDSSSQTMDECVCRYIINPDSEIDITRPKWSMTPYYELVVIAEVHSENALQIKNKMKADKSTTQINIQKNLKQPISNNFTLLQPPTTENFFNSDCRSSLVHTRVSKSTASSKSFRSNKSIKSKVQKCSNESPKTTPNESHSSAKRIKLSTDEPVQSDKYCFNVNNLMHTTPICIECEKFEACRALDLPDSLKYFITCTPQTRNEFDNLEGETNRLLENESILKAGGDMQKIEINEKPIFNFNQLPLVAKRLIHNLPNLDGSVQSWIKQEIEDIETEHIAMRKWAESLDRQLRTVIEYSLGSSEDESILMSQWVRMINCKNYLLKRQMRLVALEKECVLNKRQKILRNELETRYSIKDQFKTSGEKREDEALLREYVQIVDSRNVLVNYFAAEFGEENEDFGRFCRGEVSSRKTN